MDQAGLRLAFLASSFPADDGHGRACLHTDACAVESRRPAPTFSEVGGFNSVKTHAWGIHRELLSGFSGAAHLLIMGSAGLTFVMVLTLTHLPSSNVFK
ncbi:hypothetical protein DUNSADRAFT_10260 [Dunaliella salina]|uniref:Encoded protein n=1 Tax=Dunaliella salina TaxID=3046 RepID=A0ABQ7GFR9_DUNSA|nr:hypothetical protein DUNSADRAFT_10260 [Dunaliella salina]|eukprot:KAF5833434.1 hypothetical protein DUNSADRAFT_10260 [Dunaliella salina]